MGERTIGILTKVDKQTGVQEQADWLALFRGQKEGNQLQLGFYVRGPTRRFRLTLIRLSVSRLLTSCSLE